MSDVPLSRRIELTGGADFWHTHAVPEADLPQILLTDGPHGVRKQTGGTDHVGLNASEPATCFPPAVALASTWDPTLVQAVGEALGREARALGVGILLGPGINIKRSPLCGRNFEYFSEDPFLTGALATSYVKGVQSTGVGTSLKHFAANNQETDRMRRDSQVDERTLREIYLRAFGTVVRSAQPWSVMCSYNKVNGTYASESSYLLTQILRDEWGFEGLVVSDWGAVRNRVTSLQAGLDLEMPAHKAHAAQVTRAIAGGDLDEKVLDRAYERVSRVLRQATDHQKDVPTSVNPDRHHALARRAAEKAAVLLSNDGILPLDPMASVAVIGEFARTPRYQGSGSSRVNPTRVENALDAIGALQQGPFTFAPGFATDGVALPRDEATASAIQAARDADVVLMFLGLTESDESEGYDRSDLELPRDQLDLLDAVAEVNENVVVVVSNGAPVLLPFAGRVRAVLEGWLLGQAGGPAVADILFGRVNPSGRLAETIPLRPADVPSHLHFPGDAAGVRYGEGLFVGYRGYDAQETPVMFPFGHGLSYTTFAYADLEITTEGNNLTVSLTVTNTGDRAGREVVQAYVGLPTSSVVRAPRELKAFGEVWLEPGNSARVDLAIGSDDLAFWSTRDQAWLVEGGAYLVQVGASSRDLRLRATVDLPGTVPWRPLTLSSTAAEALAVPACATRLREMMNLTFGDDPAVIAMMGQVPLSVVAGFSGLGDDVIQDLLDQANQAANP